MLRAALRLFPPLRSRSPFPPQCSTEQRALSPSPRPPSRCRSLSDGGQSSTGAASRDRSVSGPEARRRRPQEERPCLPVQEELSTKLHPEYLLLHRPARPPRLHHGGGRRRALLQHRRHPGRSTDGGGQRGQSVPYYNLLVIVTGHLFFHASTPLAFISYLSHTGILLLFLIPPHLFKQQPVTLTTTQHAIQMISKRRVQSKLRNDPLQYSATYSYRT